MDSEEKEEWKIGMIISFWELISILDGEDY
jgi:hypothetical protein